MEWLPTVIGIALVTAAAALALLPLVRAAPRASLTPAEPVSSERLALYRQVMELEFDLQLGKLSAADFEQLTAELLSQASVSMREERAGMHELDDEIEREIAAARAAFAAARSARAVTPT
jgi:hypothetical protein